MNRRILRIIIILYKLFIYTIATLIFLLGFTFSTSLLFYDNFNSFGLAKVAGFMHGLLAFIIFMIVLPFLIRFAATKQHTLALLILINFFGIVLLLVIAEETIINENGLWIKEVFHERHFCNCMFRYYEFPRYVGISGMYISLASYFSYRLTARKNIHFNWLKVLSNLIIFIPVFGYFALIGLHHFIPKPPNFIG